MTEQLSAYAELMLTIEKHIEIKAPADVVFESLLEQLGPEFDTPDGQKMGAKIEPWPGGRWYRDLGNNTGHLWAHVQVIKPNSLLELSGPMMMSYPAVNHIQYRLTASGSGTKLSLVHRAMGDIRPEHRTGMGQGWEHILSSVGKRATR